jgi:DNA-binding CsgD family transcriptional regulator
MLGLPGTITSTAARPRRKVRHDAPHPLGCAVFTASMRYLPLQWANFALTIGGPPTGIPVVVMPTDGSQLFPLLVAAFGLTPREVQLVCEVLKGSGRQTIADQMAITTNTVQDHLKSVFAKTGARSRRELSVLFARQSALRADV